MKQCTKCGQTKSLTEFGKHSITKDGLNHWCKECNRKRGKEYGDSPAGIYSRIKGRSNYYNRKPFTFSREYFVEWYKSQPRVCAYCDIPEEYVTLLEYSYGTKTDKLTVDCKDNYLGYVEGNLTLACMKCNSVKNDVFSFEDMHDIAQKYIKPQWLALVNKENSEE